tara:strand:+ start:611 stop:958 length:348 start_codon:yes stop_codon:yes gene_type:complete
MQAWLTRLPYLLYRLQRYSAMVLAPLVVIHIGLILMAARTHPTPATVLEQFQAQPLWPLFYLIFVLAITVHVPIGLWQIWRSIEALPTWLGALLSTCFALILLLLGLRALSVMLA